MSSKIGLILSMVFVALFMAFGVDLINIQFAYTDLDSKSVTISYLISKRGSIDDNFVNYIEDEYKVNFVCTDNCTPLFGDVLNYILSRQINTIVVSKGPMDISIARSAIIGFYA